jgi:serine/threonine-protein kinase
MAVQGEPLTVSDLSQPVAGVPTPAPPAPDLSGRTLGDFRILRCLGQGGMGQVYLADQLSLKRRVALKILRADLAGNPSSLARFKTEAEAVARATHANIVQVYSVGSEEGLHYMALEYIEGRNLRDHVARKGAPDLPLALSIMRQTASALQRAAELGIIHRDIKPENILLTRKGEVKVADFGLSRILDLERPALNLTQTGVTMGTPLYMSPEQVEGKPLDPRTDIYSLGVTFYHMLTGQPPFRGQTAFEVAIKHVRDEPAPLASHRPDLPQELCALVHKMMAKRAEERYQTCKELLRDLGRLRGMLHREKPDSDAAALAATEADPEPHDSGPPEGPALLPGKVTGQLRALPAAPLPRVGPWRWLRWTLALALVTAAASGAGLGWWHVHARSRLDSGATAPAPASEGNILPFSESEREKFLLTAVEQYANPAGDAKRLQTGVTHCVELALFYLERYRLDEAERFFNKLDNPNQAVKPYRVVGRLGRAIVFALQDRTDDSMALFRQFLNENNRNIDRMMQTLLLREYPRLRLWVGKALDHNKENLSPEEAWPPELELLRRPAPLPAGPLFPPRRPPSRTG